MKEKTIKIDFFASPDDISVCKIHAVIPQQWQANNLVEIKSNNNKTLKTIDIRTWKPETHQKNCHVHKKSVHEKPDKVSGVLFIILPK